MNDLEKFALFKQAKETGVCAVCGWKDGDGVQICFYGSELGMVVHENTEKGILATMNAAQKHLYQLRQKLVYINEELREKQIAHVAYEHHLYEVKQRELFPDRVPTTDQNGQPISEKDWVAHYRAEQMKIPLSTDPQFAGWLQECWWIPVESGGRSILPEHRGIEKTDLLAYTKTPFTFTAYMVHVYEPHLCGNGHKYMKEPYYFACTGCDTEIKLWEHGVDYDVG